MRRTEGVVHVQILPRNQLLHEGRIVGRLPRIEPQVVEQRHPRKQRAQVLAHRLDVELRIRLALRTAEVAHRRDLGPLLLQPPQGGQRRPDTKVVGDLTVIQRNVEVGPDQDALAGDVPQILELRYGTHVS